MKDTRKIEREGRREIVQMELRMWFDDAWIRDGHKF